MYGRSKVPEEGSGRDPDTGIEESMWRLGLGGGGGEFQLPERPGAPDCAFYIRTGTCGYGERCRYNHPRNRGGPLVGAGRTAAMEYPERSGQPVCEYYMKTGTCKYGSTCKYDHPRQAAGLAQPVMLNYYGYPLRPVGNTLLNGEKECSYYMKTGQCKFGSTCKFDHPQPGAPSVPSPAPAFYSTVQPSSVPSTHQYPTLASWQVGRPPMVPAGSYMSGSYGPMLVSPGVVPMQAWSPYPAPINPVVTPGGQQVVQAGPGYNLSHQVSSPMPAYASSYAPEASSSGPSSSYRREQIFPERPGQPECQYYMRTGDCKYGATCKYHHPAGRNVHRNNISLSPLGLPLRPGAQLCTYYAQHGFCKFGPTCKYDHPIGSASYHPSASSLSDMPVAPYPIGYSIPTLASSSSSSDLRPEFFTTVTASSLNPSESVGSVFPKGGGSTGHGGHVSSSS
ncbi:zinc finger CCCH domain-containing protein 5-like isoform X1 [Ananas comosus]|uniref:Zinc finger CCCH domain-containing protein 5-like isoform X1 n=1 Tax=Ananas comosus TaxID=4615 RepID=A0A6P5ETU7_ANACO|nr:zinc finger CCCH domain-containing protein 5-like isoform X1 [Ananas comosus]